MTANYEVIQEKLNASAMIVRKYNLGDRIYFFTMFNTCDKLQLDKAWTYGQKKIKSWNIIKITYDINEKENQKVDERLKNFDYNTYFLFHYLERGFDVKKLKLVDESAERKLRQQLSTIYINLVSKEVSDLVLKEKSKIKFNLRLVLERYKVIFIVLGIISVFAGPRIIEGQTPVDNLTMQLYEKSRYEFRVGATCSDGTHSNATGRGACSHHGGVSKWLYGSSYHRTIDECRTEAESLSWLN